MKRILLIALCVATVGTLALVHAQEDEVVPHSCNETDAECCCDGTIDGCTEDCDTCDECECESDSKCDDCTCSEESDSCESDCSTDEAIEETEHCGGGGCH